MSLNKCLATLIAAATVALLATGCVGTACDKAADHTASCFESKSSGAGGGSSAPTDCSGAIECQANCYNQFDCSVIQDLVAGKPGGKPLADCLTQCGSSS
jgi:hypothetical protein